jgi:hypothetical protein
MELLSNSFYKKCNLISSIAVSEIKTINENYCLLVRKLFFVIACNPHSTDNLSKAKKAVIAKLKESANDWTSYEAVKWGNY